MPVSIDTMIRRVHEYREAIEDDVVGPAQKELERIFSKAEVALAKRQDLFNKLATTPDGKIQKTVDNVEEAGRILGELQGDIKKWIVAPGKRWAKEKVPVIHRAGRELARVNLDVEFVSPRMIRSVFANVSTAERAVLKVGYQDMYKIMGTVGDDVAEWFRREMLDAVLEGIPVVGKGDTLANRLIESGRLKPVKIKTKTGRIITRSVKTRAESIARIESARIVNHTHEVLAQEALGDEAVYINTNPRDSRTTDICRRASQQKPMTLRQWDESEFGRPPRLDPFHLCRSNLIGGRPEWFEGRQAA